VTLQTLTDTFQTLAILVLAWAVWNRARADRRGLVRTWHSHGWPHDSRVCPLCKADRDRADGFR